jgi:hypothetical protein
MTVAEKGLPPRDFPWLVAEPAASPVTDVSDDHTVYQDEPDMSGGDQSGGDQSGADERTTEDDSAPPPDEPRQDDRAEIDNGDGHGPVVIQGGRYSHGGDTQRGYYDGDSAAPPPPTQRWTRAAPDHDADRGPDRSYEHDDEAPPPPQSAGPPPDSSADDGPRYRY